MNSAGPAFWASSGVWTWVFATATALEYGEVIALVLHRPQVLQTETGEGKD